MVYELIDIAAEKVAKHRYIAPRADTLSKLQSGKQKLGALKIAHFAEAFQLCHFAISEFLAL